MQRGGVILLLSTNQNGVTFESKSDDSQFVVYTHTVMLKQGISYEIILFPNFILYC